MTRSQDRQKAQKDVLRKKLEKEQEKNKGKEPQGRQMSEESEFGILEWDLKKGIRLTPNRQERYEELKNKYRPNG